MKVFDRILMVILGLLVIAACTALVLFVLGIIPPVYLVNFLYNAGKLWYLQVGICVAAVLITVVAIKLMFARAKNDREGRAGQYINIIGDGSARITVEAVNDIAVKATRTVDGVLDGKSSLVKTETGLQVQMRVTTTDDKSLPEVAENIKTTVQTTLENICGIAGVGVQVMIEKNQPAPQPQRVIK